MRVAVIGRTEMLLEAAKLLLKDGHEIVAVATAKASPESTMREADFEKLAASVGAKFLFESSLGAEAARIFREAKPDVAITMNWPTMIRDHITGIFPLGIINAHGSDLPRYRGNACPNWAILMNEAQLGLSFHMIDPDGLDTGAIVLKKFLPNHEALYIGDVYDWLRKAVPEGFVEAVGAIARQGFEPLRQDESEALRAYPRRPSDGKLDFRLDAQILHRLIRASSRPFPGAFCSYDDGRKVVVWRAKLVEFGNPYLAVPGQILSFEGASPLVACGSGALCFVEFETEDGNALPRSVRARFH